MRVLSIDPGIRGVGLAMWRDGKLESALYLPNPMKDGNGPVEAAAMARAVYDKYKCDVLVLEYPRTYGGRASRGTTDSLFPLAAVDGALAALFCDRKVVYYLPQQWKNGTEKPETTKEPYVIEHKVRTRLDKDELGRIVWGNNVKHTWDVSDSIGLGLYYLDRFERKRVFARE
jgi:hypothetical protein